jgi:hypothetical protein
MAYLAGCSTDTAILFKMRSAFVMIVLLPCVPQMRMKDHDERTQRLC